MRWLLLKDLQILRRSPLLVALLIVYPIVVAVLVGLALSRGPDKPRVAFVNEVPAGQGTITLGGERIDLAHFASRFFKTVDAIHVDSRAAAVDRVRSGDALAAVVVPSDIVDRLQSGVLQAEVEVIYNGDAVKQSFVQSTIEADLARANAALSDRLRALALSDLALLERGGKLQTPIGGFDLLGLRAAQRIVRDSLRQTPPSSPARAGLQRVDRFASLALAGLGFARQGLETVSRPIAAKRTLIDGRRTPLDTFAVVVAVTLSLMFVAILLAAGMLALEREEHAFGRLVRGLVSREGLLAEKTLLGAACALPVGFLMLAGTGAFVGLHWGGVGRWLIALAAGGLAFAALGVAIGAVAREVRAASLLALLLALPLAFLSLVPSGAVASGVYDVVRVVSALFPFRPALQALDAAVNGASPGLGESVLHLLVLSVAFAVIARLALRRFA